MGSRGIRQRFPFQCIKTKTARTDIIAEPTAASRPEALQAKTTFRHDKTVKAWLIRDDRLLISIRNSFFSGSPFGQNSKVKRIQLGVVSGWVTDREVAPGCARVRTKCAEKTSIDLWGQSRSRQE